MKVRNAATRPPSIRTHLLWVPGKQATPSQPGRAAISPASWVSSPRMTSGGADWLSPGRIRTDRRGSAPSGRVARAGSSGAQGTARYAASAQPVRAPAMPQTSTTTGSGRFPSQGPTRSRSAGPYPARSSCPIPRSDPARASTRPSAPIAQTRSRVVPQSAAIQSRPSSRASIVMPPRGLPAAAPPACPGNTPAAGSGGSRASRPRSRRSWCWRDRGRRGPSRRRPRPRSGSR